MSPAEVIRLHQRVERLTVERDTLLAERHAPKRRYARCVFCGSRCKSQSRVPTCRAHRDLVALDPFYS